jgi:hypothetical protein
MEFLGFSISNALLILLGLAIGWIVLKLVLRFTVRLFACGCLVIVLLVGGGWLVSTFIL